MKILLSSLFTLFTTLLLSQHFVYHNSFDGKYSSNQKNEMFGEGELHIAEINDDDFLFEIFLIDNTDTIVRGKAKKNLIKDVYLLEYKLIKGLPSFAALWFENNNGSPKPSLSRYPKTENTPVSSYTSLSPEKDYSFTEVVVSDDKNGLPVELENIDWTQDQDKCLKYNKVIRIKYLNDSTIIGAIASDNIEAFKEPYTIFLAENVVYDQEIDVTFWYTAMDYTTATKKMTFISSQYDKGVAKIIYMGDKFGWNECRK